MRLRAIRIALGAISVAIVFAAAAAEASAKPVWLCEPGQKPDPCTPGLSTTVYSPSLQQAIGVEHPKAVAIRRSTASTSTPQSAMRRPATAI